MNTKHTRGVVTLLLAVATLATMGFSAPIDEPFSTSVLADHSMCVAAPLTLSAIELLEFAEDSCDPDLIDRVETEINWSISGQLSTAALLNSTLGSSRFGGSGMSEYLEIIEADEDSIVGPSLTTGALILSKSDYEDQVWFAPSALVPSGAPEGATVNSDPLVMTRSDYEAQVQLAPSDLGPRASVGSSSFNPNTLVLSKSDYENQVWFAPSTSWARGTRYEGFIDYHNPNSPWADAEPVASVRSGSRYKGFIDYHNPNSPWADAE